MEANENKTRDCTIIKNLSVLKVKSREI